MRIAVLADLHANLEAVTSCLAAAREQGPDAYAFVGDLVGYNADPVPVLELVAEHAQRGAIVVRGNHDEAALAGPSANMDPAAAAAIEWTRARLGPAHQAFLAALPLVVRREGVTFVHASAAAPEQWPYVTDPVRAAQSLEAAGTPWVLSGHVHEPALHYTGAADHPLRFAPVPGVAIPVSPRRQWLAIVGSAGQPRDGRTAACWALLDTERATLTFHRVPYEWRAAAGKVRAAGLPERLARRLEHGT